MSGNPAGRPVGAKNRITIYKGAIEAAVREDAYDDMMQVAFNIIKDALKGDQACRKLVWEAMMSKAATSDDKGAVGSRKVQVNILNYTEKPAESLVKSTDSTDSSGRKTTRTMAEVIDVDPTPEEENA